MLGGHSQVRKSVDDGEVEACWEWSTPNTAEERRQEPRYKTPGTELKAEDICPKKATGEAGREEGHLKVVPNECCLCR